MRCLTLAERLRDQRAEVIFVCRELPGNLNDFITARGFDLLRLPAPREKEVASGRDMDEYADWLGVSWQQDADETLKALSGDRALIDWMVVDHYALDLHWESRLRSVCERILVVDDLANRMHDCDLLLDQNLYADQDSRYLKLVPNNCEELLGPRYSLLRPDFAMARKTLRVRDGNVQRVLVFMGGSDPDNVAGKVLDAFRYLDSVDIWIDLVVGAQSAHRLALQKQCKNMPQVILHENVTDMATLMANADLAVGAGGTSSWERACLGLPSVVLSIANNQAVLAETLGEQGYCLYLGRAPEVTFLEIAQALSTLLKATSLRRYFSVASLKLVDGRGVDRVIRHMVPPAIQIREVTDADCEAVFCWRNSPEVREYFFCPELIPWEEHQRWFSRVQEDPDRVLLIGEVKGLPVGVVRYDLSGSGALVSVYLVPGRLGSGFGAPLLRAADQWLRQNRPAVQSINAEILPGNEASRRVFAAAGYAASYNVYSRVFA